MEILVDNCIASHLFMDQGVRADYGIPHKYVSYACESIIRGFSNWDHELLCCPTLLFEFRSGMEIRPIDRRMKYIARCHPETEMSSSKSYAQVHLSNFDDISVITDDIQSYLGVDFSTMNADQIANSICCKFKVSRFATHVQILKAYENYHKNFSVDVIDYSGSKEVHGKNRLADIIEGYSSSSSARVLIYYILAAIFVPVKGDTVFPFIKKVKNQQSGGSRKRKVRDRRKSFINDFLYLYFIMDRSCIFFTHDSALLFRVASTVNMFGLEVIVADFDAESEIKQAAAKLMEFDIGHLRSN